MAQITIASIKCKHCRLPFNPSGPEQEFCSGHCRRFWRLEVKKQEYYDSELRALFMPFDCPWERGPVLVDGQPVGIPEDWPLAPEAQFEASPDTPLEALAEDGPEALAPEKAWPFPLPAAGTRTVGSGLRPAVFAGGSR